MDHRLWTAFPSATKQLTQVLPVKKNPLALPHHEHINNAYRTNVASSPDREVENYARGLQMFVR